MKKFILEETRKGVSLFPIFYFECGCGEGSELHNALGVYMTTIIHEFHNSTWNYYTISGETARVNKDITTRAMADSSFIIDAIDQTYTFGQQLLELTTSLASIPLHQKSATELWEYYDQFGTRLKKMRGYGWIAPALDMTGTFSQELEQIIQSKILDKKHPETMATYFTILTNPKERTLLRQMEIELLQLAVAVEQHPEWKKLLEENSIPAIHPLYSQLQTLHQKFCWLACNYENDPFDFSYFSSTVLEKAKEHPQEKLQRIFNEEKENELKRTEAIKMLCLSPQETKLFDIASKIMHFKANRKDILFRSYYEMRPLLEEISQRLNLSINQVRFMLPGEIHAALLKNKINITEINECLKYCLAINEQGKTTVLSGRTAKEYLQQNIQEQNIPSLKDLKGSCAYPGSARGTVKLIVTPEDMNKMNEGDILVSHATNVDIVPAIKKAAAIITDSGGITCHAAIISREMRIPCLIGTKMATQIFHDGDLIFVDTEKGIIRRE